jgi:hypothetical protein
MPALFSVDPSSSAVDSRTSVSSALPTDAARIADRTSHTATLRTCREGDARQRSSAIRPTEDAATRSRGGVRVVPGRSGVGAVTSFPIFNNYNPNHLKGHKGLLENSKNLCSSVNKADVKFRAQNGKTANSKPVLTNSCKGNRKAHNHNFNKRSPR